MPQIGASLVVVKYAPRITVKLLENILQQEPVLLKNYGFVIYGYRSKLVCFYNKVMYLWLKLEGTSLLQICQFTINYESIMFYSTGLRGQCCKTFLSEIYEFT